MPVFRTIVTLFCLFLLLCHDLQAKPLTPYRSGDWPKLISQLKGQAAIIHIWGFSCGPCVAELPAWGNLAHTYPKLKLTLLQVDQAPEDITINTLTHARLLEVDNRVSADYFDEYMRYEIDPTWQGELPITLLIDPMGKIKKIRGNADFKVVTDWVAKTMKDN